VEADEIRRYHRPRYRALAADLALAVVVPALLVAAGPDPDVGWRVAAPLLAAWTVLATGVAQLPVAAWRGWWHERRFGFSTQTLGAWLGDWAKGQLIGLVLAGAAFLALVALARALPDAWPLVAAPLAALVVLLLGFVAPVVLEPLFNRFRPLADEELADALRALSVRAGAPVRDVLVADASRRTTKVNAYVSGIGRTRRVVVFDTLLEAADPAAVEVVVAHELGHRREGHVAKFTLLAMAGAAGAVLVLWAVLGTRVGDPRTLPEALLLLLALELVALAPGAWLSRRFERAADRCSLELTDQPSAFARAHLDLARRNLSDLEPPRLVYVLLFSHPTAPERLALGRAWRAAHP